MKYEVECGGFVTVLRRRTYKISAKSKEEAAEKAKDKFWNDMEKSNAEVAGTIIIDSINQL